MTNNFAYKKALGLIEKAKTEQITELSLKVIDSSYTNHYLW